MSDNKIALISGGGSGIGAATAARLGRAGWSVAVLDNSEERLEKICAALSSEGVQVYSTLADVTDRDQIERAFAEIERRGPLGAVISNAGIVLRRSLAETTAAEWDATMAVNTRGALHLAQAAAPRLSDGGSLTFVASVVAHIGFGLPAYTASKGALVALARQLAGDLAGRGIRVNAVSPGTVEGTRVTADTLSDPQVRAATVAAIPLGRIAVAEDIAAAIAFLVSEDARMITGQTLVVDGGVSSIARGALPSAAAGTVSS